MKKRIIILISILAAIFLLFACFCPLRLKISINSEKVYDFNAIQKEDIHVYPETLFRKFSETQKFTYRKSKTANENAIIVKYLYLKKKLRINTLVDDPLDVEYEGKVRDGERFDAKRVRAFLKQKDGKKHTIQNIDVSDPPQTISASTRAFVSTPYGISEIHFTFDKLSSLKASYDGTVYQGDPYDDKKLHVYAEYSNGDKVDIQNRKCSAPSYFNQIGTYEIRTTYGMAHLNIKPVPITGISGENGNYYVGDKYTGGFVLHYKDGTETHVDSSDFKLKSNALSKPATVLIFTYHNKEYSCTIKSKPMTIAMSVAKTSSDEIKSAVDTIQTNDLYAAVTDHDNFYLTHIVINDPSQIKGFCANGGYNQGLESVSGAVSQNKLKIGIPGSFYDTDTREPLDATVYIMDGKILKDGLTNGSEICLTSDGALFSPPEGVSASDLLSQNVQATFITKDPLLIENGQPTAEGSDTTHGAIRNAIGMVKPGEYYILTSKDPFSYADLQNVFFNLRCSYARSFVGGNCASLIFNKDTLLSGNMQAVDFLGVSG